ncbi:hypothetical protein RvY_03045 [Ramazzottius varieornatus]|uniref:Uncharacterized protein n=1 Tax=Ramazzottius varieornatus TaxID=947166 RepID=A0A1D1ULQ0_RAMVA|nr:hypothetical protein RvY_03045 [Ramazzottius varieornatus]
MAIMKNIVAAANLNCKINLANWRQCGKLMLLQFIKLAEAGVAAGSEVSEWARLAGGPHMESLWPGTQRESLIAGPPQDRRVGVHLSLSPTQTHRTPQL